MRKQVDAGARWASRERRRSRWNEKENFQNKNKRKNGTATKATGERERRERRTRDKRKTLDVIGGSKARRLIAWFFCYLFIYFVFHFALFILALASRGCRRFSWRESRGWGDLFPPDFLIYRSFALPFSAVLLFCFFFFRFILLPFRSACFSFFVFFLISIKKLKQNKNVFNASNFFFWETNDNWKK